MIRGPNGSDVPFRLGAERLVVGCRVHDKFVAMFVERPRRCRNNMRLLLDLLLDFGHLLMLG